MSKDLFARHESQSMKESHERKRVLRKEACERLCKNEDFKDWLYSLLDDFCAFEFGRNPLDEFTQGIRACGDVIQQSLLVADNGIDFVTQLKRRHLEEVRCGIMQDK